MVFTNTTHEWSAIKEIRRSELGVCIYISWRKTIGPLLYLKRKKKHRSNGNENVYFSLIDRCDKAECLAFVYLSFYTNRLPFKKKLSMLWAYVLKLFWVSWKMRFNIFVVDRRVNTRLYIARIQKNKILYGKQDKYTITGLHNNEAWIGNKNSFSFNTCQTMEWNVKIGRCHKEARKSMHEKKVYTHNPNVA